MKVCRRYPLPLRGARPRRRFRHRCRGRWRRPAPIGPRRFRRSCGPRRGKGRGVCVKLRPRSPRVECPYPSRLAFIGGTRGPCWPRDRCAVLVPSAASGVAQGRSDLSFSPIAAGRRPCAGDGRRKASYSTTTRLGAVFERSAPLRLSLLRFQWCPPVRRHPDTIKGPFPFPYRFAPFFLRIPISSSP